MLPYLHRSDMYRECLLALEREGEGEMETCERRSHATLPYLTYQAWLRRFADLGGVALPLASYF